MPEDSSIYRPENLPEPIVVISDLHLGHEHSVLRDVSQLKPMIADAGTVVFNGDTFEPRSVRYRKQSKKLAGELKTMLRHLDTLAVFITGNHDCSSSRHHAMGLFADRLFVVHGDFLLRYVSPWSKKLDHCRDDIDDLYADADPDLLATDLNYRLELCRRSCDMMEVVDPNKQSSVMGSLAFYVGELWPPRRLVLISQALLTMHRDAQKAMRAYLPDTRVLFVGHNHRPGVWKRNGRWVVNTGGYLKFANAAVGVFEEGELRVHKVKRIGDAMHRGRELVRLDSQQLDIQT